MQKSVYLSEGFPETLKELTRQPTRKWLIESVWAEALESGSVDGSLKSFVAGISTGGRGAAVIGLENPDLFHGVAALSGDFCPSLSKGDRLMTSALGPYRDFKTRWTGDNDLVRRAGEMKVSVFIAHSRSDAVVDFRQSSEFYNGLTKSGHCPKRILRLTDGGGHNYDYWDSEVVPMLDFFESAL